MKNLLLPKTTNLTVAVEKAAGRKYAIIPFNAIKPIRTEHRRYGFDACKEDTEVVIFTGVPIRHIEMTYDFMAGITIDKRGEMPFTIHPQLIVTTPDSLDGFPASSSFNRRFQVSA